MLRFVDQRTVFPSNARDKERIGAVQTKYTSQNESIMRAAWEAIAPGHGIVSVTRDWAKAKHLPPSMDHPEETDRVVYGIEAYHAIHCLVSQSLRFV